MLAISLPLAVPRASIAAATLPAGFTDTLYASDFGGRLTTMTFAPDGRLFVSEKQGSVRIIKRGTLLGAPFLTVSTATDSEKGLKGIAFDPQYATTRHVYVYYTDATTLKNKVSRFTTTSDPDVADPTSELVLVDGIDSGIFHSGGALHFGPDGKLYISTGDASYAPNAQNLGNLNGKILRINPNGTVPADNPFVNRAGARPEIWAYGLRNPYTFAFDAPSGRMYINDVGNSTWEEINQGQAGANYGWPACEGVCSTSGYTNPIYAYSHDEGPGKSITGAVFYRGSMFPAEHAGDFFFGDYVGNYLKRFRSGTATAAEFATNASNPVDLDIGPDGAMYYLSVERREIHRIAYGETAPPPPPPPSDSGLLVNGGFETTAWTPWVWSARSPAQATRSRVTDVVNSGSAAAKIDVTVAGSDWHVQMKQGNVSLTADRLHTLTFAARASTARSVRVSFQQNSSPYPTYFQQSVPITTEWAQHSVTFTPTTTDPRALFALNLGARTGQIWLDDIRLTAGPATDDLPVPTIDLPDDGATFRAGDRIDFSGSARDPQDGDVPPSRLTWEIVFHHDDHTHPYVEPFSGESSGSFVASDTGESAANVWYRIRLTATDGDGNQATATRDVRPVTASVTLATQPAGLSLTLDGAPVTAPTTFVGVAGFLREIGAPLTQTKDGVTYRFASWSDGGAATHTITTPASPTTLTAAYTADQPPTSNFANPGFEATGSGWLSPWRLAVRSPAVARAVRDTAAPQAGNAACRIDITTASRDWHAQLLQPNISLTAGVPHTFRFWARATTARTIRLAFQQNVAPHPVYFQTSIAVTTQWARYEVTFTPTTADPKALFNFNVGANTGSVWIDNVSLTR